MRAKLGAAPHQGFNRLYCGCSGLAGAMIMTGGVVSVGTPL
jgi:hypothetical protein